MGIDRNDPANSDHFCRCPCCGTWFSSRDILESDAIVPLGMTDGGDGTSSHLLYFNHLAPSCGSTFTIEATRFAAFLAEPVSPVDLMGRDGCEGHCTTMSDLAVCRAACMWAPYRRLMLQMRARRKLPTF